MSGLTIQWVVTIAIVAAAVYFVVKQLIGLGRPEVDGCGSGCKSCNSQELMEKRLASLDEN